MSHEYWSIVVVLGLAGWIASMLMFIFKAFPQRDRFEKRPALIWGGCVIVFFAAWITGLLHA